jgi:hypothetical protein
VIDPELYMPTMGDARLRTTQEGIDLALHLKGCVPYLQGYPLRVQEGDSCDALGEVWDGERGSGIAAVYCDGTTGLSEFYYSRSSEDAKARWTLGGPAGTDLVGKLLVLHDPISDEPLACGEIVAEAEADAGAAMGSDAGQQLEPRLEARAALAGACTLKAAVRDTADDQCPDPETLVDCATTHCELSSCYSQCQDYITCLEPEADVCAAPSCTIDQTCIACMSRVFACEIDFCVDAIACGKPTPGGPCSKLEDCCRTQGDFTDRCLMLVHQLASLSGDPTCVGVMKDWDWNTHLPVACTYE